MNIVFVLFDGVTQLDFAGPVQFLSRIPGAATHVVSRDGAAIKTDAGFSILPNGSFADCPQADILCVPGGFGVAPALGDDAIVGFVREQAKGAEWVTSVCTGAFILGAAGLLQCKRATTHWGYAHLLPLVDAIHEDARVVRDGNLVTAGGVTSGIDFALELIAAAKGPELAQTLQLALEYDPAPPFPGGHPRRAPPAIVDDLKARVYSKSAVEMEAAINALR
jgi:cyclohexyl-isocyanide hydratase